MGSDIEHQQIHDEVRVIAEFGDVEGGTSYVEHGMAREIQRLRTRVAWLETEIDHSGYVVGMASAYCRNPTPEGLTMLNHAVKQYWTEHGDDDGLEAGDVHGS